MSDSTAKLRHDLVIEYRYPSSQVCGQYTHQIMLEGQAAENVYASILIAVEEQERRELRRNHDHK